MPPLNNPRHERFAQALFEGHTADESYALAGYKPNDGNCIRLKGNERVQARLSESQVQVAKKSVVTVQSLLDELEHARARADGLDQLSAAVKAISEKAKISGLLVQRVEVGSPGDFTEAETIEEIIDATIHRMTNEGYRLDEDDRAHLADMLVRHAEEQAEFEASCKATVIHGTSAADHRWREFTDRRAAFDAERDRPRLFRRQQ
jgi:phage terminase small subunit